ncbi:mechanosensitive ion channel domain-containing protein [Orbus mooreae]|uniref:mechanosensitive ion channel domain-containing protein n=1 Tax=Orbus mooreae TaxID=3074107 RepID=UPI00370D080F
MQSYLQQLFLQYGLPHAELLSILTIAVAILFIAIILFFIVQRIGIKRLEKRMSGGQNLINLIIRYKVLRNTMLTVEAIAIIILAQLWFNQDLFIAKAINMLAVLVSLIFGTSAFFGVLDIIQFKLMRNETTRRIPIRGFVQGIKIIITILIGIIIISILIGKSPSLIISGLGAMTAILMLVFKDPIMGFVAGIQLSANNMLSVGDWLQMDKYNADGEVIDITLTTVKVQNWDKTVVLIPASSLISDAFINWQGMIDSGGRQIKRSVYVDMTSVHFLSDKEFNHLASIKLINPYLQNKKAEITEYNQVNHSDDLSKINGRHLTNLGVFRIYLETYLKKNNNIHKDMTIMVRQLAPTDHGIPIEIYAFTKTTAWLEFENIQADIFDHLFAIIPEFGLRIHQLPSGYDLRMLSHSTSNS